MGPDEGWEKASAAPFGVSGVSEEKGTILALSIPWSS